MVRILKNCTAFNDFMDSSAHSQKHYCDVTFILRRNIADDFLIRQSLVRDGRFVNWKTSTEVQTIFISLGYSLASIPVVMRDIK